MKLVDWVDVAANVNLICAPTASPEISSPNTVALPDISKINGISIFAAVGLTYVQVNVDDTVLPFPPASVKALAATFTVTAPNVVGVNVAVYVVPEPANEDKVPFVTVISPTTKLVVDSLETNFIAILS